MATQFPKVQGEDTFDGIADRPVSAKGPAWRIRPLRFESSPMLKNSLRERIVSIPTLLEHAVIRLLADAGRANEQIPDRKVASVIQTVVSRVLTKACCSTAFYLAVEEVVQSSVPEPPRVDTVAAKLDYAF